MEMISGIANIINMVDRMVLEGSERKVKVDRNIACLKHKMVRTKMRVSIMEEWKEEVTEHMRDIGEAQGGIQG